MDVIERKDPKVGVNFTPPPPRKPESLSQEEYDTAAKVLRSDPLLEAVFAALAETGARFSEVLGLCTDQIGRKASEIDIDRQMAKDSKTKEFYLKEPRSRAGFRTTIYSPALDKALTAYMKKHPPVEHVLPYRYRNGARRPARSSSTSPPRTASR